MKSQIFYLITTVLFLCLSCENGMKPTYTEFPEEINRKGKPVEINDTMIFSYPIMKVKDSICVFFDDNNTGKLFHIYRYPEFQYLYSLCSQGKGHNEISGGVEYYLSEKYLYVLSLNECLIYLYDVKNRKTTPEKIIKIDEARMAYDFAIINDKEIAITLSSGNYRLNIYDPISCLCVDSILNIPKTEFSEIISPGTVWNSVIESENNFVAAATIGGEVIDIINTTNNDVTKIVGPGKAPKPQKNGDMYDHSVIRGFSYIQMTDKYIYCLFSGVKTFDFMYKRTPLNNHINVYDYSGNAIKTINIHPNNIISFYVDEIRKKIYFTIDSSEKLIYECNI